MNDLANTTQTALSRLDALAVEAQTYAVNLNMSLFGLGRVFTEARTMLPDGEWGVWVMENTGMKVRTAEQLIQSYSRFGSNPAFANIGKSNLVKMLPLPSGTEEDFLENYDVADMTAREVEKAVKEYKAQLAEEKAKREEAERRAAEAEKAPAIPDPSYVPPETAAKLQEYREEVARLGATNQELITARNDLKAELDENKIMMQEQQETFDAVQQELNELKTSQARGEADHGAAGVLSYAVVAEAVQQFIGTCARLPHMERAFATMSQEEKDNYESLLMAVEQWADGVRSAIYPNIVKVEGFKIE